METAALDYDLPASAIAQTPVEPRDAARLLVDTGPGSAPEHRHVRDLPSLIRPGDVVVVNTTRVLPARLRLTKPTGGAVEVLLLEPVAWRRPLGGAGPAEPQGAPGHDAGGRVDGLTVCVGDDLGEGRRHVELAIDAEGRSARRARPPRRGAAPAVHHDAARGPRALPDHLRASEPGSVAAPTAGLHLTPALLDARPVRRCDRRRRWSWWWGSARSGRSRPTTVEEHEMHAERYRVPAATMAACERAERVVAIGTTSVRALESAAATGELEGSTEPLHPRRPALRAGGRADDQLPPAALVAARAGRRVRRAALAIALRRGAAGPATASSASATPCSSDGSADDPLDGGHRHRRARSRRARSARLAARSRTPCFMPVGTKGAVRHLSSQDLSRPRRPDRARQHLPPDAQARRRRDRSARRPARLRRLVGPRPHRLRRLPDLLAGAGWQRPPRRRRRHVPLHLRRRHAPPHARGRGRDPDGVRERHPDGARRLRTAARRATPCCARRSIARRRGRHAPAPRSVAQERPDLNQFGIVQGGTDLALRAESAERTLAVGLRRLRHRGPLGRRVAGGDARDPRGDRAAAPGRPAPLPDGPR